MNAADQRCEEQWRYIDGTFGQRCALALGHAGDHEADFGDGTRRWFNESPVVNPIAEDEAAEALRYAYEQAEAACDRAAEDYSASLRAGEGREDANAKAVYEERAAARDAAHDAYIAFIEERAAAVYEAEIRRLREALGEVE